MKLAVISDTHFGDDTSRLATTKGLNRPLFDKLAVAAGTGNDYLILLGDIFDFSISDYAKTYTVAEPFFHAVRESGIATEVIYIPGNHDFSFWNLVMHQANVINRIMGGRLPVERPTVPGVLDTRAGADPRVTLVGVERKKEGQPGDPRYGGLFLDYLSGITVEEHLPFNIAYPNLYLIEPNGETTLFTHGHYFDTYWAMTVSIARQILGVDLMLAAGPDPDIDDYVTVNFPLNELASAGLGQAGPLTDNIRAIQKEAKEGSLERIRKYVKRARDLADQNISFGGILGFAKEYVSDKCLDGVRDAVLKVAEEAKNGAGPRDNAVWLREPRIHDNALAYLRACVLEMHGVGGVIGGTVPPVTKMIYGHTHKPTLFDLAKPVTARGDPLLLGTRGPVVQTFNTGGCSGIEGIVRKRQMPRGSPTSQGRHLLVQRTLLSAMDQLCDICWI